ncbi:MAG: right-handed parallel beta-helix repeat-containing protein [Sphaerochaetaceae bacterium]
MFKNKLLSLLIFCLTISLFTISLFADALEEGTYIVNRDGTGDFESFEEISEILSIDGINGPVVFKFAAGTYEGPFQLEKIVGSSEVNTVTFTSDGYAPTAVFTRSTVASNNKHILLLLATKNVILENLTFKITAEVNAWGINIRNRAENIVIRGCVFISEAERNDTNEHILILNSASDTYAYGNPGNSITIEGNSFTNGNMAICVNGQDSTYLTGIVIQNNKFTNIFRYAMRLMYLDSYKVNGNVIEMNPDGYTESCAINVRSSQGGFEIIGNRIIKARRFGIEFGYYSTSSPISKCHNDTGEMSIVANNMIGGGFTYSYDYGTYTSGIVANAAIENVAFYYNSINMDLETGNFTRAAAITLDNEWSSNISKDIRMVNNSFACTGEGGNGRAVYIRSRSSVIEMDYNNYYTNTSKFAYYGAEAGNLATLRALDGKNSNSIVGDPKYLGQFDLHSYAAQLSGMGKPIAGITIDIDGDDRDATNPCIGADEYIPMFDHDIAVIGLTGNNLTKVGTPETVKVKVRNEGRIWQPQYTLYLMRDTGETLATLEVNEILWQQGDEAEHEMTWVPVAKGIHRLYALVHLEGDENHNNDRYPVGNTFNVMVQDLTELPQPQVSITGNMGDSSAKISWEPIIGANSYKVYASSDPFAENWPLFTTTSNTFANVDLHYEGMLFFRVIASTAQTLLGDNDSDYLKVEVPQQDSK